VRWTGPSPPQNPNNWDKITYKYDPSGRRIKKTVDGYKTTYCHDGGHEIAEYDGNGNLLRKYVYGPGVDQPVCMIEVADSNAVSYYHFDGLGSVVALSNSSGTTIQTYEYTVYGQVAASDPNHTNPFLFTGRRFDIETGLYYYRARYYNPYIGRFLQTDPVGYGYIYCGNNPLAYIDPSGLIAIAFYDGGDEELREAREESADDFWVYYNIRKADELGMSHSEFIIWILETWNDLGGLVPITEIYIYDHANSREIQIGDELLKSGSEELAKFAQGIRDNTKSDTIIHFRGCNIAAETGSGDSSERKFLIELAKLTERTVTACEGTVRHLGGEWFGPDYDFEKDVYKATYNRQDGTVEVDLYYDAQPMIMNIPGYGPVVIPDYITAVIQGRRRPY